MQLLLQTSLQLLRGYLASLLTILRALHIPSQGVSKFTMDRLGQFSEVSSIIRHSFSIGHLSVYIQSPNIGFDSFAAIIA